MVQMHLGVTGRRLALNRLNTRHNSRAIQIKTPLVPTEMAWDTMAVLMAGYESAARGGGLVDITEYTTSGRTFEAREMPEPEKFGRVFQRA